MKEPISHASPGWFPVAAAILLWLTAGAARAETCPPLKLLNQIRMIAVNDGTILLVPVTINGIDKVMLLDTGASASSVTRELAQELGLHLHQLRRHALHGLNGDVSRDATIVTDFKFGQQEMQDVPFRIWPNPELGKADPRLAGVLLPDQLFQDDLDIDFANGILRLFSPQHCEGHVLYWKANAVTAGDFNTRGDHINIQVTLDGQKLNAIIDSGASQSVLSADAARRFFGLTGSSPGMTQTGAAANDPQYPVYQHEFSELDFNGVAATKPVMTIWPDVSNRNADRSVRESLNRPLRIRENIAPPQLIIGMDVLKKLHIYFAVREHRMYVSEAESLPPK